jgi:DNA-binding NarL/FixJ family response regulator
MELWIADGQSRVRFGLRVLLEQQPGWKVTAEITDADELQQEISHGCPDVLLLDCDLPGLGTAELLHWLKFHCAQLRIILLCSRLERNQPPMPLEADAFASKAEPPEKLLALIRELQF